MMATVESLMAAFDILFHPSDDGVEGVDGVVRLAVDGLAPGDALGEQLLHRLIEDTRALARLERELAESESVLFDELLKRQNLRRSKPRFLEGGFDADGEEWAHGKIKFNVRACASFYAKSRLLLSVSQD